MALVSMSGGQHMDTTDVVYLHVADSKMGLDLIREMFANATKWKMNTVRIYAHTTDPEHPFMVRHGCPCFS